MNLSIEQLYQNNIKDYTFTQKKLKKKAFTLSILRLVFFFVLIALFILLVQWNVLGAILITLLGIWAFGKAVTIHKKVEKEAHFYQNLVEYNENELKFVNFDFHHQDNGDSFKDNTHPYALDLDVFGTHSLFQFINRSKNVKSTALLAQWFTKQANHQTILNRQSVIKEMVTKSLDIQHFFSKYTPFKEGKSLNDLLKIWEDTKTPEQKYKWLKPISWILPIINLASIVCYFMGLISGFSLTLICLPSFLVQGITLASVNKEVLLIGKITQFLDAYLPQILHIENNNFESSHAKDLQKKLFIENKKLSKTLTEGIKIQEQFDLRNNFLLIPILIILFWDTHILRKSQQWKNNYAQQLEKKLDIIHQFEALFSLSQLVINNPNFTAPIIHDEKIIRAKEVKNPLIPSKDCVPNDIELPTAQHIKLLTGSNMAGKSTFLRSVGCNIVLAMMGSYVSSSKFELPLLKLITSMRTVDSLMDSTSSFWAELKRLKYVLDEVKENDNIYFLLDEILKGTNSRDRHKGNRALIKQLLKNKGAGILATHDLELTDLEKSLDGQLENVCIEVQIENGEMSFDRKLQKGYSQSYNATLLMQKIGIEMD